jgi:hypothetical protein
LVLGDTYLIRTGIALLICLKQYIMGDNFYHGFSIIRLKSNSIKLKELLAHMSYVRISQETFDKKMLKFKT